MGDITMKWLLFFIILFISADAYAFGFGGRSWGGYRKHNPHSISSHQGGGGGGGTPEPLTMALIAGGGGAAIGIKKLLRKKGKK